MNEHAREPLTAQHFLTGNAWDDGPWQVHEDGRTITGRLTLGQFVNSQDAEIAALATEMSAVIRAAATCLCETRACVHTHEIDEMAHRIEMLDEDIHASWEDEQAAV